MSPHQLQQKIHSTFSSDVNDWADFRLDIEQTLENLSNSHIFDRHLLREFNRKVVNLGLGGLAFIPYDAGFGYLRGEEDLIASNIVLGSDEQSVFDTNYNQVLS